MVDSPEAGASILKVAFSMEDESPIRSSLMGNLKEK